MRDNTRQSTASPWTCLVSGNKKAIKKTQQNNRVGPTVGYRFNLREFFPQLR